MKHAALCPAGGTVAVTASASTCGFFIYYRALSGLSPAARDASRFAQATALRPAVYDALSRCG